MEVTITNKPKRIAKNLSNTDGALSESVKEQKYHLLNGCPKVELIRPATIVDGILSLSENEKADLIKAHENLIKNRSFAHFIPASGAGSRMLKALIAFANDFNPEEESFSTYINRTQDMEVFEIFKELKNFPFYDQLKDAFQGTAVDDFDQHKLEEAIYILYSDEIGLASLAKGLIPFHKNGDTVLSAFESQLELFCEQTEGIENSSIHFTIDQKYQNDFLHVLQQYKEQNSSGCLDRKNIGFSYQNPDTNTVALDEKNNLVTLSDDVLFTRPAGHGCLLENLQELEDKDLIYISNIDNVVDRHLYNEVINERKVIQAICLTVRKKISYLLNNLATLSEMQLEEVLGDLSQYIPMPQFTALENMDVKSEMKTFFNKPLRVCGMVINEGKAGGGPFWIKEDDKVFLQIVEGVEIDTFNTVQKEISLQSTHFNPVEIALSIKDYNGGTFNLNDYKKKGYAITAKKSIEGKPITALERHGLWNGCMLDWLTIFVEVSPVIFNPVKQLSDLTNTAHQAQ